MPFAQDSALPSRPLPRARRPMTKTEAREWVHTKLIIVEMAHDELVAAFTALAERPPETADRQKGLFQRCCEIIVSSASPWEPLSTLSLAPPRKH